MLVALSPPLCSSYGWPLELEPTSHGQNNYINRESETCESILHFSSPLEQVEHGHSTPYATSSCHPEMVKKLHHNACERDRRRKINGLYSSLRSLLPGTDQSKKLSIPTTVSHVLKYIPKLQEEVGRLKTKKETLLSRQGELKQLDKKKMDIPQNSLSAVSASELNEREVLVHISTKDEVHTIALSEVLINLEEEYGLHLINAASFESFGGSVFINLHFQVEGAQKIECKALREKLLSLYDHKREQQLFGLNPGFYTNDI